MYYEQEIKIFIFTVITVLAVYFGVLLALIIANIDTSWLLATVGFLIDPPFSDRSFYYTNLLFFLVSGGITGCILYYIYYFIQHIYVMVVRKLNLR